MYMYRWTDYLLVCGWTLALLLHNAARWLIRREPFGFEFWVSGLAWREEAFFWKGLLLLCGGSLTLPDSLAAAPWQVRLAYYGAGPAANLAVAGLISSLMNRVPDMFSDVATYAVGTNLALGLISLLPVPGLDGGNLIATLWRRVTRGV